MENSLSFVDALRDFLGLNEAEQMADDLGEFETMDEALEASIKHNRKRPKFNHLIKRHPEKEGKFTLERKKRQ